MIKITAYGRANFGLIALNGSMKRVDGSFGIALNVPAVTAEINSCGGFDVPQPYREVCGGIIERLGIERDFGLKVKTHINAHCGLGLGTQLRLAVAKALILYKNLKIKDSDLLKIVKRGGTSDLGYYAFLNGGFITECGHRFGLEKQGIGPGHAFECYETTPLIYFPEWGVCLITPKEYIDVSGDFEKRLFAEYCPIPENEINELCRYVLMGVIPAVHTADFDLFCHYLETSMRVGFRSREMLFRMPEISANIEQLKAAGFKGVGMTSFGPTVFGFAESTESANEKAQNFSSENNIVTVTTARNRGADIKRA